MTVATNADPESIAKIDAEQIGPFPITGTVSSLDVVAVDDGGLRTIQAFPLSGQSNGQST